MDNGTTGYLDSEVFTLTFTNVPEPATAGLLLIGALAIPALPVVNLFSESWWASEEPTIV